MRVFFDVPAHAGRQISTHFGVVLDPGWNEVDDIKGAMMLESGLVLAKDPHGAPAPIAVPQAPNILGTLPSTDVPIPAATVPASTDNPPKAQAAGPKGAK